MNSAFVAVSVSVSSHSRRAESTNQAVTVSGQGEPERRGVTVSCLSLGWVCVFCSSVTRLQAVTLSRQGEPEGRGVTVVLATCLFGVCLFALRSRGVDGVS